jgi:hypothetical protein
MRWKRSIRRGASRNRHRTMSLSEWLGLLFAAVLVLYLLLADDTED